MDRDIKIWLYDILNSIMEIDTFLLDKKYDFIIYQKDIKTKRAIEWNIEIIGEAMNRILKHNELINITASRQIVDIKNRVIHGYDSVSDEMIWSVVQKHLPILQKEVSVLLGELS